jgi:hypothetical protein
MIYSRSTSGRREGDCVIHVPPQYGGSLFIASPEPIKSTEYEDVTERADRRDEMSETRRPDEAYKDREAFKEGGMRQREEMNQRDDMRQRDETHHHDEKHDAKSENLPVPAENRINILNKPLTTEDLLLIGLIILLMNENNGENFDLVLMLAALLVFF